VDSIARNTMQISEVPYPYPYVLLLECTAMQKNIQILF